jgi:alpha-ribazole phosphatase
MLLYALRHTKVDVPTGICYGQTDVNLASTFEGELTNIKDSIEGLIFDYVYSSPLIRCRLLAENLRLPNNIVFEENLKELNFGNWETQSWEAIFATKDGKHWMDNYLTAQCPNGESYYQLLQRIELFLQYNKRKHPNATVLWVTHSGVIVALYKLLLKKKPEEIFKNYMPSYGELVKFQMP